MSRMKDGMESSKEHHSTRFATRIFQIRQFDSRLSIYQLASSCLSFHIRQSIHSSIHPIASIIIMFALFADGSTLAWETYSVVCTHKHTHTHASGLMIVNIQTIQSTVSKVEWKNTRVFVLTFNALCRNARYSLLGTKDTTIIWICECSLKKRDA